MPLSKAGSSRVRSYRKRKSSDEIAYDEQSLLPLSFLDNQILTIQLRNVGDFKFYKPITMPRYTEIVEWVRHNPAAY